jgi:hypothetical protein
MLSLVAMLHRLIIPPPLKTETRAAAPMWPLYLGLGVASLLIAALYLNTLSLPFFQDDVIHLRWLSYHSLLDPWLTAENLPNYRPLGEFLLKLWSVILGYNAAAFLRLQNILMHLIDTCLVAALALCLDPSERRYIVAGLAAMLFAVFPFAYQAVVWINVFFYPLGVLLMLSCVLSYYRARTTGKSRWLWATWLLCFLAPAEIEWGLMTGALLFGLELYWYFQRRSARLWLPGPVIGFCINVLFLLIYLAMPKFDFLAEKKLGLESILQNSTYYLQGLTYPTAPLAVPLMEKLGLNDLNAVRVISLLTLIPLLALLIARRRTLLALACLGWFLLLIIPTWVTVGFDYVINSPRILYPAVVGVVILWASFLAELMSEGRWQKARIAIVLSALGLVIAHNITFVRAETQLYHLAEEPVHTLTAAAAQATEQDEPLLFVNLPSWLAPINHDYALGNHGVQFIAGFAGIKDVIFANSGIERRADAIGFTNLAEVVPYYYGIFGRKVDWGDLIASLNQSGDVYVTRYEPERIQLLPAGRVTNVELGEITARLGSQLELGSTEVITAHDTLSVMLNWRIKQLIDQDLSVFVHIYGPDGQLVTQSDGYPLLGLAPFGNYSPGQTLQDRHTLVWPPTAPSGMYRIGVGVYDRGSGQRLEAHTTHGERLPADTGIIATLGHLNQVLELIFLTHAPLSSSQISTGHRIHNSGYIAGLWRHAALTVLLRRHDPLRVAARPDVDVHFPHRRRASLLPAYAVFLVETVRDFHRARFSRGVSRADIDCAHHQRHPGTAAGAASDTR